MPTYRCECGAKYRFPESAIGRRARCKECSAVFTLEEDDTGPIPLADEPGRSRGTHDLLHAEGRVFAGPDLASDAALGLPSAPLQAAEPLRSAPLLGALTPAQGYGQSILWTFLFLASPRNMLTFVVAWVLLTASAFAPSMLAFVSLLVALWYAAFRFAVIETAASGEEDIPSFNYSGDVLEELAYPAFRWLGSWALVMLPAFLYVVLLSGWSGDEMADAADSLSYGLNAFFQDYAREIILIVLTCAGLFVWPIIVLSIAIGGFTVVYRLDLMIVTIFRSLPPYLLTVGIVVGATVGKTLIDTAIQTGLPPGPGLSGAVLSRALYEGGRLYCDIVLLRAIGLYYHHFKHRFAWDWG